MHQEAVNILRNAGDKIKLIVCDGLNPSALQNSEGNENYIDDMDVQLLGANLLADTSITSEIIVLRLLYTLLSKYNTTDIINQTNEKHVQKRREQDNFVINWIGQHSSLCFIVIQIYV